MWNSPLSNPNTMGDDDGWETVPKKPIRKKAPQSTQDDNILPWVSYIPPTKQNSQFEPFMLLLCGIPGSGKSTFARSLQQAMPYKFVRINQDDLGNRQRCEEQTRLALINNMCPIIDRCNFDKEQRTKFIAIAAEFGVPVDCVVMGIDTLVTVDECIQRCQQRRNHPTVKPAEAQGVVLVVAQQMQPPPATQNQEGIRHVKYIENTNFFNDTIVEYLNK